MTEIEFAGGWKLLCGSMLHYSVSVLAQGRSKAEKDRVESWISDGNTGEVTFVECCAALGYDPMYFREKLNGVRGKPIRKRYCDYVRKV